MGKEEHAMRTERNANVLCMSGIVGEITMHDAIGEMPSVYEGLLGTLDFTLKPRAISKNVYYPMSGKSLCMQNVELWKHQKGKALKSCISSPRRGRQDTVFICVAYLSTEIKWFLVFFSPEVFLCYFFPWFAEPSSQPFITLYQCFQNR